MKYSDRMTRTARRGMPLVPKAALALASWLAVVGCGGVHEVNENSAVLGTVSQELRCQPNVGDPEDPNCPWKYWAPLTPDNPANDIVHTRSPAICAKTTALTISVDENSRYRTLQWHSVRAANWGSYGNRTFASNPTCALREDAAPGQAGFVIAGKGTDGKLYASPGTMSAAAIPQNNATPAGPFSAVSSTVYNTAGFPALASGFFFGGGGTEAMVLAFMGDDRRTVHAHRRSLPYSSNSWSSRITGPQLPAGWQAIGAPAMAKVPTTAQIVVYARNGSQKRLFTTHFDGTDFSGGVPGSPASFQMLESVGDIDSAPSLTFSQEHGLTVYFQRNGQVMQTSGFPLGSNPVLAVKPDAGLSFSRAPAGHFGWQFESQGGAHLVVARTNSGQLFRAENFPDNWLDP